MTFSGAVEEVPFDLVGVLSLMKTMKFVLIPLKLITGGLKLPKRADGDIVFFFLFCQLKDFYSTCFKTRKTVGTNFKPAESLTAEVQAPDSVR